MKLILGSRSIGRYQVLKSAGYKFEVMVSNFDEESVRTDDFHLLPLLLAREKSKVVLPKLGKDTVLLTSDQVVIFNNTLREKPKDKIEAKDWLNSYSNNSSQAITSVVAVNTTTGKTAEGTDTVTVYFKKIPEDVIDRLIAKGRVMHTAGGCVGEDPLLNPYIKKLDGDLDSLTGLPLKLTKRLLREVGFKK